MDHSAAHLETLYHLVDAVSRARAPEEIYDAALAALRKAVDIDRAAVLLFDPDGVMRFKASFGLSAAYRQAVEGHTPWARDTRHPYAILVRDVMEDLDLAAYREVIVGEGIRALGFIPLVSHDAVIGKFMLYADRPHAFSENEVRLAQAVASHVAFGLQRVEDERRLDAVAIENARLYESAQTRAARLRILAEVTRAMVASLDVKQALTAIAEAAAQLTGARLVSCWIADERTRTLVRCAFNDEPLGTSHPKVVLGYGEGGVGWVAAHRQSIEAPDLYVDDRIVAKEWFRENGFTSALEMPILFQGALLGVIALFGDGLRLDADEREVMGIFVAHAAVAIRNAQLYEEAADRRREAEAANEAKDQFLAMLSHELRNPLAPMLSALHILGRPDAAPEALGRARDVIDRQVKHQARLLDDLLDIARITHGKIDLRTEALDAGGIVGAALESVNGYIAGRRHRVRVSLTSEPLAVLGDRTRLIQVVANLLQNAAKYTPRGGEITVVVERDGAEALVRVRDTGIGIDADLLPRVFDLFTQGDRSLSRAEGGLGIGLTLVRRLVELHGGRVHAESEGRGRGSEFIVRLPLASADPSRPAERRPRVPASGRRILVIEDNADSREMLRMMLELEGHVVPVAEDGAQGLAAAAAEPPEVVLVDIGLPGLDGYEVARALRAKLGHTVRLVALTGYGQPEDRRRAHEAGFDRHLVKPVTPDALMDVLAAL